jgi:nanoRNase/pAp phosphatase (c-di-AMP/oligoRNAs hydrolase)
VIDHRKFHHADEFINAKQNIELVGSASTLIAEKFSQNSITPSREVAVCLYAAIVSNTI